MLPIVVAIVVVLVKLSVALAASAFFNVVALGLWVTDFARAPTDPLKAGLFGRLFGKR